MEGDKKGLTYRLKCISNIIKHGLFLHGVRNNLRKFDLDFRPDYWVRKASSSMNPPEIRGVDKDFYF
jgi:hypothetical protein